jgi:sugar (pentulose or hexulose) kinase
LISFAYLGIDLGTSGCRGVAIDAEGRQLAESSVTLPPSARDGRGGATQRPEHWWQATQRVLRQLVPQLGSHRPTALAVDGTSATLLLTDAKGQPLGPALMYDDSRARDEAAALAALAPPASAVHSPSSSLAKLLWLSGDLPADARHALHQAEWITGQLTGRWDLGDENNCLKLGYDPVARRWPDWFGELNIDRGLLPAVKPAGTRLGSLRPGLSEELGLPHDLQIVAGTTDSVAAALACGLHRAGDGATALGSTLAIKLLSPEPVFAPAYGVYSHRLFDDWLVGGASNSGGAVLRQFFSDAEMAAMQPSLQPDHPTGLDYYPLPAPGERFPVNDPQLAPRITPRPKQPVRFFQGLLEGIAAIEAQAYRRLQDLGAPAVRQVFTTGGGARNSAWQRIRQRHLGVPVSRARHDQAAYGAALLARSACRD